MGTGGGWRRGEGRWVGVGSEGGGRGGEEAGEAGEAEEERCGGEGGRGVEGREVVRVGGRGRERGKRVSQKNE